MLNFKEFKLTLLKYYSNCVKKSLNSCARPTLKATFTRHKKMRLYEIDGGVQDLAGQGGLLLLSHRMTIHTSSFF